MDPPRCKGSRTLSDPRIAAIPDIHGHAKGEHRPFAEERPIAYSARMLFLWFFHACRRNSPRFLMVSDHINYLTFEDPGAVNTVRRALKLAHAGDLYGAAETAGVDVAHAAVVGEGLRRGMRYSIGAEVDNDPRARPDAQNIVDAMRPDAIIRSVKFLTIDHPEKGGEYAWPFDNAEFAQYYDTVGVERVWELYVARLLDDIEKLPGHIVGDFYRPGRHGHWPDDAKLQQYEDQMLDAALSRGMAIEVYARPFYRDIPQEQRERLIALNKRLMRKAKEKNVPIAIGSGAHSPKDQGGGFDTVLQMLDECEINEIVFPVGGRLARVALRATKEHIEKHQKTQEPAQPGSSISGLSRAELGLPEEAERGEEVSTSKTGRDAGPKKRASSPTRTTKKPEPEDAPAKSSSRRSAESAASSAKAKEDAATSAAEPPLLDEEHSSAESVEPVAVEPPAAVEAPSPARAAKKSRAKTAAANVAAGKTQPVAEPVAAEKLPAKAPAVKKESAKAVNAAKAPAKKAAAKSAAAKPAVKKAPAKIASKSVKAAAKKAPAKKAAAVKKAAPAAKKAAPKKTAAKLAPKPKKTATKSAAKKPAAKKTATATRLVKKASKPASKGTTTKKKSTKRR